MIGQILRERYKIQQPLGKQTGRQTLLAHDLITQELVVIKILVLGNNFEWQDLKLFEREAETLKMLSHPAIPRYLDYFEIDLPHPKGFAIVQSYVQGKTLEDHLKSGRTFSEAELKELAKSLLEILRYLHEHRPVVIHRDIKPSNILLTNRSAHSAGQIYLVDFGSVQTLAAKEGGTITVVGTYGYMPPEQFGGRAVPASDLYSLGATLIYLVTGLHPTELPQKDCRIQFKSSAKLDPAFADWLEWMTEPSLDKRLPLAEKALQVLALPTVRKKAALSVRKPYNSEVELTKDKYNFEITIPARGLGFGGIALISFTIPLVLFLLDLSQDMFAENVISYGIVGLILVSSFIQFNWFYFNRIILKADSRKINLTNQTLGFQWNRCPPASRQAISELEWIEFQQVVTLGSESVKRKFQLIIWAGNQKYVLDETLRLTEAELKWLACELSDWLGLPINNSRFG